MPDFDKDKFNGGSLPPEGGSDENSQNNPSFTPPSENQGGSSESDNSGTNDNGTGTNHPAKPPRGGSKPRGTRDSQPSTDSSLLVEYSFKKRASSRTAVSNNLEDAAEVREARARAAATEMQGKRVITNTKVYDQLNTGKTGFVDTDHNIIDALNSYNNPDNYREGLAVMPIIERIEELLSINTLCTVDYSRGSSHRFEPYYYGGEINGTNAMLQYRTDDNPLYPGQYIGHSIYFKQGKITKINLISNNPKLSDNTVMTGSTPKILNANGQLRSREIEVVKTFIKEWESAKDISGVNKNPFTSTPEGDRAIQTVMDVSRNTVAIIERAFICAAQFMAGLSQDIASYGQDQAKRFAYYMSRVRCILDLKSDAKKVSSTAMLTEGSWLRSVYDEAVSTIKNTDTVLWCYPKTCIAMKPSLQRKISWSTPSKDHRSVATRNVLTYNTIYPYSDITHIDGEEISNGIGGRVSRRAPYYSTLGQIENITIVDPIFDGIQAFFDKECNDTPKTDLFFMDDEHAIPLTFDPEFPQFSFLVLKAMAKILDRLQKMQLYLEVYCEKGGVLPSTCVKYPLDKLWKFLQDANYSPDHWKDYKVGKKVEVLATNNYRMRYPETLHLANEDEYYAYYRGVFSRLTMQSIDGSWEYTGRHKFPISPWGCNVEDYLQDIDPILYVPNDDFMSSKLTSYTDDDASQTQTITYTDLIKLGDTTVRDWLKGSQIIGILRGVPSCLLPFDPNDVELSDSGAWKNVTDISIALDTKLVDVSNDNGIGNGVQISSFRMAFPIPIDDYANARVVMSNRDGSIAAQKEALCNAFLFGSYNIDKDDRVGRYMKRLSESDAVTGYTLNNIVCFPFNSWQITGNTGTFGHRDDWGTHARFMMMYSNPFIRAREDSSASDDSITMLTPHQFMTNKQWMWVNLDWSSNMRALASRITNDDKLLELSIFGC